MNEESDFDDEETYRITRKGLENIWTWVRFQTQMCDLEHRDLLEAGEPCEDDSHIVAWSLPFIIPTLEQADAIGLWDR